MDRCAAVFVAMVVDGMDLQMLSLALSSITKELHLSPVSAGALGTYTLVGMGIGGVLAGRLSDRAGRLRVIRWAVFVFTVCTGIIGFVQGYWQIAVMRFISGRHRCGIQPRNRRCRGIRAHENPHDRARHRSSRLVCRIRRCCAPGVLRAADVRLAPLVLVRHRAWPRHAPDAARADRPSELDLVAPCSGASLSASRASGMTR